jgi:hypothetical protein
MFLYMHGMGALVQISAQILHSRIKSKPFVRLYGGGGKEDKIPKMALAEPIGAGEKSATILIPAVGI